MKNKIKYAAIAILLSVGSLTCTKVKDTPYANAAFSSAERRTSLIAHLLSGQVWAISKFTEGTSDLTNAYSGYTLQFTPNGAVVATGENTVSGTWMNSTNDDPNELQLHFYYYPEFGELYYTLFGKLNENWVIAAYTNSYFRLISVSDHGKKYLSLIKQGMLVKDGPMLTRSK